MTEQRLDELVREWDLDAPPEDSDVSYAALHNKLGWFGRNHWSGYLPAQHQGCNPSYTARLAEWVGNATTEEEQKLLLSYAADITFLTHDDVCALYRAAFDGPITQWVIDQAKLRLTEKNFQTRLREELNQRTWYCPVTDSMDINEFYHVNQLTGISHRPPFSTEQMFAARDDQAAVVRLKQLRAYMAKPTNGVPPIERLVLLEDFVGFGTQTQSTVSWAAESLGVPVLFVPLMICPQGMQTFEKLSFKNEDKLTFKPLLPLARSNLLGPARESATGTIHSADKVEAFARSTFERVAGGRHRDKRKSPYTPFGWEETGCSLVTYSNTPNNTLPLIHHRPGSGHWKPLFPRVARV